MRQKCLDRPLEAWRHHWHHSLDLTVCVCFLHPQLPLPEEIHWTPGDSKLHDMSAEEVANQLVAFDWELFSCVHEVRERDRGVGGGQLSIYLYGADVSVVS